MPLILISILVGSQLISETAFCQNIKPTSIIIDYNAKKSAKTKSKKTDNEITKNFKSACKNLGKAMLIRKGPWGVGAFNSFSCSIDGKKVSGKEKQTDWKLSIVNKKSGFEFELKDGSSSMASLSLPFSDTSMMVLKDPELIDLIVYQLLEQMPYAFYLDSKNIQDQDLKFTYRHWQTSEAKEFKYTVPKPPADLVVYRLQWDQDRSMYRSTILGKATLKEIVPPKLESKTKDNKKIAYLKGGTVSYTISKEVYDELKNGPAWAHQSEGPGSQNEDLTKIARQAKGDIDSYAKNGQLDNFLAGKTGLIANILESAASGYVGMRYGRQVLPAEGELGRLLDDTSLFNLIAEVRGGPVKGLRYYYDKLPETKMKLNSADGSKINASLAFARHVLGYSFDFQFPFLVDRITVDPKMGVWTFNATLPVAQDEAGLVTKTQAFNLGSTVSIAVEIGGEIIGDWYTLRGFYANDAGFSVLKQGGSVTSNRFGGDAFFKAGPTFKLFEIPFKTALLGSFIYESVAIRRGVGEVAEGETTITGIVYSVGYAQGGVAISW